jgi:putative ABC transport system permease protein
MKLFLLIIKNIRRNLTRSILTGMGTMVLVLVVTLIWSVLSFLDEVTRDKKSDFKAIVTERWQIPSQMPYSYAERLKEGAVREPGDVKPTDSMVWSFYGGFLGDAAKRDRNSMLFALAMEPEKIRTMLDELDLLPADSPEGRDLIACVEKMKANRAGLMLGKDRLAAINKRVGERITLKGLNYKEIDLEFEIVGIFPKGRYDNSAVMNVEYLRSALDAYPTTHAGKKHPLDAKSLNLVWLRVPNSEAFTKVASQIMNSPEFSSPAVKCETASSGVATFLEAYQDQIWGLRWLLAPAAIFTLSLVIANAISISVRERRTELAVMKVLGFRPAQILMLVLGESLLLGTLAGLASAGLTYWIVNDYFEGIPLQIAFFPKFLIPVAAFWWGPAVGAGAALVGAVLPSWNAQAVKVSEVFAKVA